MTDDITEATLVGWFDSLSNWGRWGDADELGTLNLITDDVRRRAASLVTEGSAVSCAWTLGSQFGHEPGAVQRFMIETGEGLTDAARTPPAYFGVEFEPGELRARFAMEHVGYEFHGLNVTHLDAPCHYFWDGQMYNGVPAARVSSARGALHCAVTVARQGITSRGVLIDLDGIGRGARPDDVERFETEHDLEIGRGDIVLLRTGAARVRRETGVTPVPFPGGWDPAMLPWFREREVAAIGADVAQEVYSDPPRFGQMSAPIHIVGLVAMGLWLIDNVDVEDLAQRCAELDRYAFHLAVHPLPIEGATGSAVNPIATF